MGGDPKCDGHKLPCLFEAGSYEAHYMTTGSKERIFPHTFVFDRSYDAVGGGRVDVLRCSVCDYIVPVKSHVHDYGWNWDCTGFDSIYEYTFNIGGSTKTVEELIIESDYAHPEKCKVPGCEEFIMVPHSWGRWNVVENPDTTGSNGGMEAECSICEYTKTKIDKDDDEGTDHWTKDTALVTVKNGRATRMIVKPGDKIKLYPEERTGQKAIGWKVEYLREYNDEPSVSKQWNYSQAKSQFKLVTNGSALEWGCTIPEFSAMGAPGGGSFFFEPVYAGCDHSGGTTVLNAKEQICDRKGYTGDTACADCGHVISAGSDIYPPANAGHTGPLQPLYYYGTANSATTDASHGGKRYNAKSGDCRHRAYEGDYRCTTVGGCSFNVADVLYKLDLPFESYMPVGEGRFADLVAQALTERGYPVHREAGEGDNGWCLSLADASGERTFISMFGLERRMKPDWFERFDIESFDYFYVSGYQAEGENGRVILEALSRKRPDAVVVFDPGPRVHFMPRERVEDFCRLGCLFTVNADEALFMTGTTRVEDAALRLHDMSGRDAVVTDGGRGAIVADNASVRRIPGFPVAIVDTIGSGDAHTGGVIAGLMCGLPIDECVLLANRVASVVTGREGGACAPTIDELLTEHC